MKITYLALISILILTLTGAGNPNMTQPKELPFVDTVKLEKSMPEWAKKSNIYEVNVRQYTPEGTFKAFQTHLPRLKEMGVDILWLMPINPIGVKNRKGTLGSYYAISNYKEVNPEFGTEADLKNLVTEAHRLGMHVIIDWVANHTSWDNVWIESHPDWYNRDSKGEIIIPDGTDWADVADLNYDNPDMRKAMIDAMAYWVKKTDIDGFRCDVAGMVPMDFWLRARKTIDATKPCFYLAEDSQVSTHQAFDMSYGWHLKDMLYQIAVGKKNAKDLAKDIKQDIKTYKPEDVRMRFISNHDENTWSGSESERMGDAPIDASTVLIYTVPGMPLTYTGQEEPLKKRLSFFDKDLVGFGNYEKEDLFTKLNELKKENKALWNITYGGSFTILNNSCPESVFTFVREKDKNKVLCIFNFSNKEQNFKITGNIKGSFTNYMGVDFFVKKNQIYKLRPWEYSVLVCEE